MVCEVSAGWKNDSLQERNVGDGSGGSEQSKRRAEEQAGGDAEIGETAEAVAVYSPLVPVAVKFPKLCEFVYIPVALS